MKQSPWLEAGHNDLSGEPKFINANLKLFTRKYKNDIEGEQALPKVQEDVPTYLHLLQVYLHP